MSDNPEWTDDELASAKPFAEALPALAASVAKRGQQKTPTKVATSIRLDPDVVAGFKATGKGWQSRINEALRDALRAQKPVKGRRQGVRRVSKAAKKNGVIAGGDRRG